MTGLIFLNVALHHDPYSKFLYYLGKDMIYRGFEKNRKILETTLVNRKDDLVNLYQFKNFPISMGVTNKNINTDQFFDMN